MKNPYQAPTPIQQRIATGRTHRRSPGIIALRIVAFFLMLAGFVSLNTKLFISSDDRFRLDWFLQDVFGIAAVFVALLMLGFAPRIHAWWERRSVDRKSKLEQ